MKKGKLFMMRIKCLRCDTEMEFVSRESIQLGQSGFLLGNLPNMLAGALDAEIYVCPKCRRLEFFAADAEARMENGELPQKTCPECGEVHDFDYPKCPNCNHNYYS